MQFVISGQNKLVQCKSNTNKNQWGENAKDNTKYYLFPRGIESSEGCLADDNRNEDYKDDDVNDDDVNDDDDDGDDAAPTARPLQ